MVVPVRHGKGVSAVEAKPHTIITADRKCVITRHKVFSHFETVGHQVGIGSTEVGTRDGAIA